MNLHFSKCSEIKFLSLALFLLFVCAAADANDDKCQGSGGYGFVCGPQNAEDLVSGPANEHFSNSTMALQVGNDIWIGTFSGDRIGYRSLKQHD
jgi:hypothetical protein